MNKYQGYEQINKIRYQHFKVKCVHTMLGKWDIVCTNSALKWNKECMNHLMSQDNVSTNLSFKMR